MEPTFAWANMIDINEGGVDVHIFILYFAIFV